jgi:xylan 1,4-beta-xylosidase
MHSTRRGSIKGLIGGSLLLPVLADAARAAPVNHRDLSWAPGIEGQRKADLGNGTFLNPIVAATTPIPPCSRTTTTIT